MKNFQVNNIEIKDLEFDIDEVSNEIYDIFTPLFNNSISKYKNTKNKKIFIVLL